MSRAQSTGRAQAEPKKVAGNATCRVCDTRFIYEAPPHADPPRTCGHLHCRALDTWGPGEWDGAARMADARMAADIELSELDIRALNRRRAPAA